MKEKAAAKPGRIRRLARFVTEGVWDVEMTSLGLLKAMAIRAIRVVYLVVKGYSEDECPLYASSLTYTTLLAIVPLLAFSLAVARGLGGEQAAKEKIRGAVAEWTRNFGQKGLPAGLGALGGAQEAAPPEETREKKEAPDAGAAAPQETGAGGADLKPEELAAQVNGMVDMAFQKVENISFAGLGAVGLVLMLWTVIVVLGSVEAAFNRVWGVTAQRPVWRKVTDYTSVLFILPLLGLAAGSVPVAESVTRFLSAASRARVEGVLDSVALKHVTTLGMTTLCFTFVIMFMPNTRVKAKAGLAGGVVTALLFLGWMWLCAALQVGAARAGRIYGSFAIVPIMLAWVYVSWQIVLFGAEVAFAIQNCGTYRMESTARAANMESRIILGLSVAAAAARAMLGSERGFDAAEFAASRRVPVRFLNGVIEEMVEAGLLAELSDARGRFVLLRSPEQLRVREVIGALMASGVRPAALGLDPADPKVGAALAGANRGMEASLRDSTVRDLL